MQMQLIQRHLFTTEDENSIYIFKLHISHKKARNKDGRCNNDNQGVIRNIAPNGSDS